MIRDSDVASIIVSSVATPENLERAVRAGADDFVAEPLHVTGVVMRIAAMLRRSGASLPVRIRFDRLEIDVESREVTANGAAVELTAKGIEEEHARRRWLRTSRGVGYDFDRRAASPCRQLTVGDRRELEVRGA